MVIRVFAGGPAHAGLRWCEAHELKYIVGVAPNACLLDLARPLIKQAQSQFEQVQQKQRLFGVVQYAVPRMRDWDRARRVLVKAEHTDKGSNPSRGCGMVANLEGDAQSLYDGVYCARGQMENRIKEQQLGLFADRTSCSDWPRMLSGLVGQSVSAVGQLRDCAYVLMERLRALGLASTEFARAQVQTTRVKLLKIGAVVLRNIPHTQ